MAKAGGLLASAIEASRDIEEAAPPEAFDGEGNGVKGVVEPLGVTYIDGAGGLILEASAVDAGAVSDENFERVIEDVGEGGARFICDHDFGRTTLALFVEGEEVLVNGFELEVGEEVLVVGGHDRKIRLSFLRPSFGDSEVGIGAAEGLLEVFVLSLIHI